MLSYTLLLISLAALVVQSVQEESFPASPVIGILAQPWNHNITSTSARQHYIAASYVKWLEAGGARTIPIPYDATDDALLDDLFGQIQALFLPGGDAALPYAVHHLLDRAMESNQNGHYFPVWGTCLGYEFLIQHVGGTAALQSGFDAENASWSLQDVQPVHLYRDAVVYQTVLTQNVTLHNHKRGIEPMQFVQNPRLTSTWQVTSTNHDRHGRPFVSTIEPVGQLPFYGVQYHPEKNAFEYATWPHTNIPYENINHSPAAVQFSMSMARFVVHLAQQTNHHAYSQPDRFPVTTTYPQRAGLEFEQVYLIPPAEHFMTKTSLTANSTEPVFSNKNVTTTTTTTPTAVSNSNPSHNQHFFRHGATILVVGLMLYLFLIKCRRRSDRFVLLTIGC